MSEEISQGSTDDVGYKRPPRATRFQKGRSGNPKGRPKNRKRALPYDHVLGQMVTVRDDGKEKRVTAAEAFLLHLTKRGLEGDGPSMRAFLAAVEAARINRPPQESVTILRILFIAYGPGIALESLGMAIKKFATDKDKSRFELKAWIVEAALARFSDRTLSVEQQKEVWHSTYRPHNINWPAWWKYRD